MSKILILMSEVKQFVRETEPYDIKIIRLPLKLYFCLIKYLLYV